MPEPPASAFPSPFYLFYLAIIPIAWIPGLLGVKKANILINSKLWMLIVASSVGLTFGAELHGRALQRFLSRTATQFSILRAAPFDTHR